MLLKRGELLKTGFGGALLLIVAGCGRAALSSASTVVDSSYRYRVLTPAQREIVAAIAGVMLAGAFPHARGDASTYVLDAVRGVDSAILGLTPSVQAEIQQLFGLLEFPLTRALVAGVWAPWSAATQTQVASFLTSWRFSNVTLLRSGYDALHQLIMAGWYGNALSWPAIGYPGPPRIA